LPNVCLTMVLLWLGLLFCFSSSCFAVILLCKRYIMFCYISMARDAPWEIPFGYMDSLNANEYCCHASIGMIPPLINEFMYTRTLWRKGAYQEEKCMRYQKLLCQQGHNCCRSGGEIVVASTFRLAMQSSWVWHRLLCQYN